MQIPEGFKRNELVVRIVLVVFSTWMLGERRFFVPSLVILSTLVGISLTQAIGLLFPGLIVSEEFMGEPPEL